MSATREQRELAQKALQCLYIQVPASVVDDVRAKLAPVLADSEKLERMRERLVDADFWGDMLFEAGADDPSAGLTPLDTSQPDLLSGWIADVIAVEFAAALREGGED